MTLVSFTSPVLIPPSNENPKTDSSFDNISQSRGSDTLMKVNSLSDLHQHNREIARHTLQYDVRRLNINDSLNSAKKVNSEQLVSTPTTLLDPSQPSLLPFNHHRFLISHTNDHDDRQSPSSLSSTDYTIGTPKFARHDQPIEYSPSIVLNQNRVSQRIPTTSSASPPMPSESGDSKSVSYGVDWSDQARSTSHCWFPSNYPSTAKHCTYAACSNLKSIVQMPFLECGSCGLVLHAHHLNDSHTTEENVLLSCRPSFIDNPISVESHTDAEDNSSNYDKHFWTYVSTLTEPSYVAGTNPWGKPSSLNSNTNNLNHVPVFDRDKHSLSHVATSLPYVHDSAANAHEVNEPTTVNCCNTSQCEDSSTTTIKINRFDPQDFSDQRLEVVGLSSRHMAAIHIGFRGNRIAQCNHLRIELCASMTAHMDGEPFYLPSSIAINISHGGQVLMLRNDVR
ncbi:unnamed protein product [Rotaria sp. Silwood1]|nr:unnamed protein product [Rotaria sp. Silwood1]